MKTNDEYKIIKVEFGEGKHPFYTDEMITFKSLAFPSLLSELRDYVPPIQTKVKRVYALCLKHKHYKWATEIYKKYSYYLQEEHKGDMAMAMGWALLASKNLKR